MRVRLELDRWPLWLRDVPDSENAILSAGAEELGAGVRAERYLVGCQLTFATWPLFFDPTYVEMHFFAFRFQSLTEPSTLAERKTACGVREKSVNYWVFVGVLD